MARLFDKAWRVTIARPMTGRFFQNQTQVTTIEKQRITFKVEKNLGADPNTCTLSIFNLAPATRAELERKPIHITLEAGYDGQIELLFVGDMRWSRNRPAGTEWETRIEIGDGERAYRQARVNRSFRGGVSAADAVREVATTMELTLDETTKQTLATIPHVNGLSLSGPSYREMTRLLSPHGLSWSIQDSRLQVLAPEQVRGGTALLIEQDNGMIGSPEWGAPGEDGKPPRLNVKTLLRPSIYAGRLVEVRAKAVNGRFKPEKVMHSGDSHGADWFTELEAKAL